MRLLLLAAAAILSGCAQDPEVAACEGFARSKLSSPSTYRLVSSTKVDGEPVLGVQFPEHAGMVQPAKRDMDRELWDLEQAIYRDSRVALRQVALDYDSANEAGVMTRSHQVCAFRLVNGEPESRETINRRALQAAGGDPQRLLLSLKGRPRPPNRFDCCL